VSDGERHVLDPATRLGEVLFGLIMVLSFTGSLHVATAGREEIRTMLIGALGCNIAWGIVDAVMYVMNELVDRTRANTDLCRMKEARTPEEADAVLAARLPPSVVAQLQPGDLARLRERFLALPTSVRKAYPSPRLLREALGVFLLVIGATFPAAAPFLLISDVATALRVSNIVALSVMFVAGWVVGKHAGVSPLLTGFGVTLIGAGLVGVTTFLGG
jgi:hypothetical protein